MKKLNALSYNGNLLFKKKKINFYGASACTLWETTKAMLKTMNNFILYEQNLKHKQLSRTYDLLRLEDNLNLELKRASKKKKNPKKPKTDINYKSIWKNDQILTLY